MDNIYYVKGCLLTVEKISIIHDKVSLSRIVTVTIKNNFPKNIKGYSICCKMYMNDEYHDQISLDIEQVVGANQEVETAKNITINNRHKFNNMKIYFKKIIFDDDSSWTIEREDAGTLKSEIKKITPESKYYSIKHLKYNEFELSNEPCFTEDFYLCTCGCYNIEPSSECKKCHVSKEMIAYFTSDAFINSVGSRLEILSEKYPSFYNGVGYLKTKSKETMVYKPLILDNIWICSCGGFNTSDINICHRCTCTKEELLTFFSDENINKIAKDYDEYALKRQKKNKTITIVALVLLVLFGGGFFLYNTFKDDITVMRAEKMYEKGNYDEALHLIENIGTEKSYNLKNTILSDQIDDNIKNKKYNEALEILQNNKMEDSRVSECYYLLGKDFYDKADYRNAILNYTKAIKSTQNEHYKDSEELLKQAYYGYASKEYETGNYENAGKYYTHAGDYEDAAELSKKSYYESGMSLFKKGYYVLAVEQFELAKDYSNAADCVNKSKYKYIETKNTMSDTVVRNYVSDLKKIKYPNIDSLVKQVIKWKVTTCLTTDKTMCLNNVSTYRKKKQVIIYLHYKLSGGEYLDKTAIKVHVTKNNFKSQYGTGTKFSSGQSAIIQMTLMDPPKGKYTVKLYAEETGQYMATTYFTIE